MQKRILIVAGSDSGGGAGIQADIKTVTCLGGYAATAITALTAQNTKGVFGMLGVDPAFVAQQMTVVLDDIGADAIKIGMLHDSAVMEAVGRVLTARAATLPVVVDPVMVAKGGAPLLDPDSLNVLKRDILLRADVLTPNLPEAEALSGLTVRSVEDMRPAAAMLHSLGPKAVLLKGGHLASDIIHDVLAWEGGVEVFESARIDSAHTHGTGCTLASAIATGLAQGLGLVAAVRRARDYVLAAIRSAPGIGGGHGPLNHGHTVRPFGL